MIDAVPESLFDGHVKLEVVVINDGSTDQTAEKAEEHGAFVIYHTLPQGVGASFSAGIQEALRRKADYAVNIDADGQIFISLANNNHIRLDKIREGMLTREEAVTTIDQSNKISVEEFLWYCNTIGIEPIRTVKIINQQKTLY